MKRKVVKNEIVTPPLISVITVSYNAVATIEQTILSVINQTYPNIEYIIIDGGSKDGTIDIIRKYADQIAYWVSEPDEGIYDAMNKGIKIATGEWINFMNCGDSFLDMKVLNKIFISSILNEYEGVDILYGNRVSVYSFGKYFHLVDSLENFSKSFPIFHQSTFVRRVLLENNLFDLEYNICADYNQLFSLYKQGYVFKYIPQYISICECENGVSTQLRNELKRVKENELIINNKLSFKSYFYLFRIMLKTKVRVGLEKIYPQYFTHLKKDVRLLKNKRFAKL